MENNPIQMFKDWYSLALLNSPLKHPKVFSVSTVNFQGIPETRFVALKDVSDQGFVFCSALDSPKGMSISANANVALTFWWDHIERQVRVTGTAKRISNEDADKYFRERRKDAQITTLVSEQSKPLESQADLEAKLQEMTAKYANAEVPRPKNWGGYAVKPSSIEFLEFKPNRLHIRTLFTSQNAGWSRQNLQP